MEKFEMPVMEITYYSVEDVITTSVQTNVPCTEDL